MSTLSLLVGALRVRGPLDRSAAEMAGLLTASRGAWPTRRPLVTRLHSYTRTCVYRDDDFEVLLLNWDAGAVSALHDHGGQHCWLAVLEGELRVDDYVRLDAGDKPGFSQVEPTGSRLLGPGGLDLRSGRFDLHRVSAHAARAVSLHVYARPLRRFLVYDEQSGRCQSAIGTYDEVLERPRTARAGKKPVGAWKDLAPALPKKVTIDNN